MANFVPIQRHNFHVYDTDDLDGVHAVIGDMIGDMASRLTWRDDFQTYEIAGTHEEIETAKKALRRLSRGKLRFKVKWDPIYRQTRAPDYD